VGPPPAIGTLPIGHGWRCSQPSLMLVERTSELIPSCRWLLGCYWFRTSTMDGVEFLEEILSGRRRWYRPGVLVQKRGLWALKTDLRTITPSVTRLAKW
jgi:hypothetical protein